MVMALAGCAPLTPTPPFHFAETGETMPRGRVAVAAAGGAGNFETIGGGVGLGARVRYGIGGGHELRLEGAAIARINDDEHEDPQQQMQQPWLGKSTAWLYKLSWKKDLTRWLAVIAGAGGSDSATGNGVGADVALLLTSPRVFAGIRPYAGGRFAFAEPVSRGRDEAGGPTQGLAGAVGGALDWSAHTQLVVELGFLYEHNRGYFSTSADPGREIQSQDHPGGYLLVGATYYFGGRRHTQSGPSGQ